MSTSLISNAFLFIGNAGCVYLRIKSVFAMVIIIPFFSILLSFLVSTKTENDAYTVVGRVEAVTAFNSVKVSYADPVTNNLVTANVNTSIMNQSFITVGSPLTVYIDKQNMFNVHAQQPLTKTIKFMIIAVLFFILSSFIRNFCFFFLQSDVSSFRSRRTCI